MPVDWTKMETLVQLLVCMYPDHKFDYKQVAKRWTEFYGGAVSYHSVEGFFRKIRKEATALEQRRMGSEEAGLTVNMPMVLPQARQRTPKTPSKPRYDDGKLSDQKSERRQTPRLASVVSNTRIHKTPGSRSSTRRAVGAIKLEQGPSEACAPTPSSMSATSETMDQMSLTEHFDDIYFGTPGNQSLDTLGDQYDMRGFDDEAY